MTESKGALQTIKLIKTERVAGRLRYLGGRGKAALSEAGIRDSQPRGAGRGGTVGDGVGQLRGLRAPGQKGRVWQQCRDREGRGGGGRGRVSPTTSGSCDAPPNPVSEP